MQSQKPAHAPRTSGVLVRASSTHSATKSANHITSTHATTAKSARTTAGACTMRLATVCGAAAAAEGGAAALLL